ncbi:hypothetical protein WMF37_47305 [Sorangium sp. So ce291]|uniref:hypothetical protein n=1 Tax=Sorangium sp. So ce291 TaxID=3133294 RepID=UPI003F63FA5D
MRHTAPEHTWNHLRIQGSQIQPRTIEINGYKHAMVQVFAASIAANRPVLIKNAPLVDDTYILKQIIEKCGGSTSIENHQVLIDPRSMSSSHVDPVLSKAIHGSLYLMPALATHLGEFVFHEAGGCQIGSTESGGRRPFEHMLDIMSRFGIARSTIDGAYRGERRSRPESVTIDILNYSTHPDEAQGPLISSATKTAILCALATKKTRILHPYLKTDVMDLLRLLKSFGCRVKISEDSLEIHASIAEGAQEPLDFKLTSCGSEIISYIALAVHTHTRLELRASDLETVKMNLKPEFELLSKMNVDVEFHDDKIIVSGATPVRSVDIDVTHSGIQSDHHPFFALMLLHGTGHARIREYVWKDRFAYVEELKKLGADMTRSGNHLFVTPSRTSIGGQTLLATDTRSAAVLTLAALRAEHTTVIKNAYHLRRGYEDLIPNLQAAGARVETLA